MKIVQLDNRNEQNQGNLAEEGLGAGFEVRDQGEMGGDGECGSLGSWENRSDGKKGRYCKQAGDGWPLQHIKMLFQTYNFIGPKWKEIAVHFKNKPENSLKNKFHLCLRKFLRKLNSFIKQKVYKHKKLIKYEGVIHLLSMAEPQYHVPEQLRQWNNEIRQRILLASQKIALEEQVEDDCFQWLMANINRFNKQTKSYRIKKSKSIEPEKVPAKNLETNKKNSVEQSEQNQDGLLNASKKQDYLSLDGCEMCSDHVAELGVNVQSTYDYKFIIFDQDPLDQKTNDQDFGFGFNTSRSFHQEFERSQSGILEYLSSLHVDDILI